MVSGALSPALQSIVRQSGPNARQPRPLYIVGPGLCVLVIVIASAILFYALGIHSYPQALVFAGLIGAGFLVANTTNIAINPNIPRPFLYSSITSGYHLLGMTLTSLILMAMR